MSRAIPLLSALAVAFVGSAGCSNAPSGDVGSLADPLEVRQPIPVGPVSEAAPTTIVDDDHTAPSIHIHVVGASELASLTAASSISVSVQNDGEHERSVEIFGVVTPTDGSAQRASLGTVVVPSAGDAVLRVAVSDLPARLGGGAIPIQFVAEFRDEGGLRVEPAEVVVQGWSADLSEGWLGDQRSALEIGNRALATLAQKGNRTVPKDDAGKRALSHELRKLAVWEERDSSRPGRRNRRVPEVLALPFDERAPAPLVLPPPQENRGLGFPTLPRYKVCLQWDNTGAFRDSSGVNATAFVSDVSPAAGLQVTFQWPDILGQTGSSSRYLDNDGCATLTFTTLRFVPSYISVYATSRFGTPGTAPATSPSDAFFELNPVAGQSLSFTTAGTSSRTIAMPAGIASRIGAVVSRIVTMVDGLPPITSWTPYGGTTTAPIYWATTISDLPSGANCSTYAVAANATATTTTNRQAEAAAGGTGACFGMLLGRSTTTGNYYPLAAPGDAFASPTSSVTFERTTIGHELGHVVQARTFGLVDVNYPTSSVLTDGTDPNAMCNCQHVGTGNSRHCLQGRMNYGPAFNEGFAHYFAARVFNEERSGASGSGVCTFPYYKDVKYESWNIAHPPVAINCATPGGMLNGVPTGWQRARCNKPVVGGDYTGEQATEWDFLTFLWSLSSGKPASSTYPFYTLPADAITFTDVQTLVKGACNSGDVNQTFLCTLSSPFNWGTLKIAGSNKWGEFDARFVRLTDGGFRHGVNGAP